MDNRPAILSRIFGKKQMLKKCTRKMKKELHFCYNFMLPFCISCYIIILIREEAVQLWQTECA